MFAAIWAWFKSLFTAPQTLPNGTVAAAPPAPQLPAEPKKSDTPWLDWLEAHIGEPEVTGSKATAFDKMVFSHTSDDEVEKKGIMAAGCAATLCAALELTGYKSTHRADAISYKSYGTASELKRGAIVVFQWDGGGHHVTVCNQTPKDKQSVACTGGNQSHKLQPSTYTQSHIIAVRWPVA